ncbi:MAG: ABC transporter ATP-binding protein [Gammaproteobacteria bacterium]|nr:ABC transporter ATP-binding protein [Gammaproteobacteria bacterium]
MSVLELRGVEIARGGRTLLAGLDLSVEEGETLGVIGPNGAGKSSLLRVLAGLEAPARGELRLDGAPLLALSPAARARQVGYHPQQAVLHWPLTVRTVVALGRLAHGASLERLRPADQDAVTRAMQTCGLEALAARRADRLSGGELARVHIARLLAGEHRLLLADEPIANLDPRYQLDILAALRGHARSRGAALVVLHDLNIAARHCDRLLLLAADHPPLCDTPARVLSAERIAEVFKVPLGYFHEAGIAAALAR